ncbi:hypothetical protein HDU98_003888 [Podochytrium sp. JEL0797]|nr:hypothetical protein HDU98_003888 [Podochytrium sp. JEL0797]
MMEEGAVSVSIDPAETTAPTSVIPGVSAKIIALTIDDSPSIHTAEILDILHRHNAKATFFIIGSYVTALPDGEELLARMVREGHELANHTMLDRPTIGLTREQFEEELVQVDAMIMRHQPRIEGGVKWFRPGSGVFSQEMVDIAESHGYRTILGCRFPVDTTSKNPTLNSWHVCSGIHPGAIVVLHDAREWIKPTLEILLPQLNEKGYEVVNAGELYRLAVEGGGVEVQVGEGHEEEERDRRWRWRTSQRQQQSGALEQVSEADASQAVRHQEQFDEGGGGEEEGLLDAGGGAIIVTHADGAANPWSG